MPGDEANPSDAMTNVELCKAHRRLSRFQGQELRVFDVEVLACPLHLRGTLEI